MTALQKENFKQAGKIAGISLPVLGFAWMIYASIQTQFNEKQKQLNNFQTKIITNEVNISNINSNLKNLRDSNKRIEDKIDKLILRQAK